MRQNLVIVLGLLFFLVVGLHMEHSRRYGRLRRALRCPQVPTAILNRGSTGQLFQRLRLVRPVKNDGSRFERSGTEPDPFASLFQKKRFVGYGLYEPNPDWRRESLWGEPPAPSPPTPTAFKEGWPILSVQVLTQDLVGEKWGVDANWRESGREWERLARMAYFENGSNLFSTLAGIRLHGKRSREPWSERHSFRLYFRDTYGADQFKPGLLFGPESEPLRHLVVHDDWPTNSPFANSLSFDVVRRIGGVAPPCRPVMFILNGEVQGMYFLSEQISRPQWVARMGHRDFIMRVFTGGGDAEAVERLLALRDRLRNDPERVTLDWAARRFDLDSLTRFIFSIVYCGTADGWQGAGILDRSVPEPKWSWIHWDMDHSFWDPYGDHAKRRPWQTEGLERVLVKPDDPGYDRWKVKADIRALLFTRLMNECPDFRRRYVRQAMDWLNHRITEAFMKARIDHYETLTVAYGREDRAFIRDYREFAQHRAGFLREEMSTDLGVGRRFPCTVKGPPGLRLRVDGYPEIAGYSGEYFEGETVDVILNGESNAGFRHWIVNGRCEEGPRLTCRVSEPLVIEAVCGDLGAR